MKKLFGAVLAALSFCSATSAEEPVVELIISQQIQNRVPLGPTLQNSDRFKILNNKLYAWTKFRKKISGQHVHHIWYFQNQLMDDIRLPVVAQYARIYSAKTVRLPYAGVWRVEIQQDDKTLLETRYFLVEKINNELVATVLERNRP